MDFFTSLQHQLNALQRIVSGAPVTSPSTIDPSPSGPSATDFSAPGPSAARSIPERLHQLSDGDLQDALKIATSIQRQAERLRHSSSSVLAQRARMAPPSLRTRVAAPEQHPGTAAPTRRTNLPVHA